MDCTIESDAFERTRIFVSAALDRGVVSAKDRLWALNTIADELERDSQASSERLFGLVMPRPSEVARLFYANLADDPVQATSWFYRLCVDADYVKASAIARNIQWSTATRWGDMQITINLSKPEKDPRAISAAGAAPRTASEYPACRLCMENEGYAGRGADDPRGEWPPRQNLRIVPLDLGDEPWGMQYSPYAYYNEHCIVMSSVHRPMHIDRATFGRLLDFVDVLPHYFIGSNADLPIVGGSILSHDHFQGGRHSFPMQVAPVVQAFDIPGCPDVAAGVVRWPLTVVRLQGRDRAGVLDAACRVLDVWRGYSDPVAGVLAETDGVPHNTITPIVRRIGSAYQMDLALRCNVATPEHPLGLFHVHEHLHRIKKENLGLIEVMGLAILPPRLCDSFDIDDPGDRGAIGRGFAEALECAGVFKWDEAGRAALQRFIDAL
ncbi:UDP-glucose--hexose-1-phosphate uridylyltransferase [Curtanaerobium respiraculi]|uniref:UDP-glucose--hexose-1-phosphate uridylyltransferase n=1 Tax=Curtanaerobium respiraculi TaxID=2949669 RepID=UPI0024B3935A|nr:UDP-glucose--hexose-1-phosphate uridylyltransferase [Curtanaerobium respiraculi]